MSMERSCDSSAGFGEGISGRAVSNLESGWTDYLLSSWDDHHQDVDSTVDATTSEEREPMLCHSSAVGWHASDRSSSSSSSYEELQYEEDELQLNVIDLRLAKEARDCLIADHLRAHRHLPQGLQQPNPILIPSPSSWRRQRQPTTVCTSDASSGSPPNCQSPLTEACNSTTSSFSPRLQGVVNMAADRSKGCKRGRTQACQCAAPQEEIVCNSTVKVRRQLIASSRAPPCNSA
ncbi:hypothetical protein L7F22_061919 [Adiantum nelumboides]|nr:hypothetical protein [Adiantum nelumboides]